MLRPRPRGVSHLSRRAQASPQRLADAAGASPRRVAEGAHPCSWGFDVGRGQRWGAQPSLGSWALGGPGQGCPGGLWGPRALQSRGYPWTAGAPGGRPSCCRGSGTSLEVTGAELSRQLTSKARHFTETSWTGSGAAGGWCLETNAVLFCRGHCILVLESDTHQDIESHKIHRCSETPPVARETDTRGDSQGRGADLGSFLWIREETWSSEAPPGGCDRHSPLSALTGSCGFIFLLLSRTHTQSLDVSPAGGLPPRSPRTARPHLPPTRLSQVVWKSEAGGCASGCSCVWGVGCVCVCVRARVWWACVADVFNPLSF